jgi:hypothetical protein
MWDAWAAYDATAVGYMRNEKVNPLPQNIDAARHESISYAAYHVLRSRFATGSGSATSLASFDSMLTALGYSTATAQAPVNAVQNPAELGKRIGAAVLAWGAIDGFSGTSFPQAYNAAVNPNMDPALVLSALGTNGAGTPNMPLGYGIPAGTHPNFWQPLSLSNNITQNGIPEPSGPQGFVGVQGLSTQAFSLRRSDETKPWLDPFGGPSRLTYNGQFSATDAEYKEQAMGVLRASSQLNSTTMVDISPAAFGNNPLGTDDGLGYATNPVTGGAYAVNQVARGDFVRVLAEFWADGPNTETPPGHWQSHVNESGHPARLLPIQDAGLHTYLRSLDIRFASGLGSEG